MQRIWNKAISTALVLLCAVGLTGCETTYESPEDLLEQVREELSVSDAETIELQYAGMCVEGDKSLLWYISGSENQAHTYIPVECEILEDSEFRYQRTSLPLQRGMDIFVLPSWPTAGDYAFCINNPNCAAVRFTDETGTWEETVPSYPYVFYILRDPGMSFEYIFRDAEGNELR